VIASGGVDAKADVAEQVDCPVDPGDDAVDGGLVSGVEPTGGGIHASRSTEPVEHREQPRQHLVEGGARIDELLCGVVEVLRFDLDRNGWATVRAEDDWHRSGSPYGDIRGHCGGMVAVTGRDQGAETVEP
jgi:hypothetical protein